MTTVAIKGATLVRTDGTALADAVVVVEGACIRAVGAAGEVPIPTHAEVLDVSGKWILPGLIDAHIHFFQSGGLYTRPDILDRTDRVPYSQETQQIRENLNDTFARYLLGGTTSVVDVGGPFWNFEVREKAANTLLAPRVAVTGPLISTVRRDKLESDDSPIIKAETPEAARALVRPQIERGPDFVKIWFLVMPGEKVEDHMPMVRATIEESHAHGVRVAVHATEQETARAAVEAGADVLVHSVFDVEVDDAFVKLLVDRGVLYTTTLVVHEGYDKALNRRMRLCAAEHRIANPYTVSTLFDPFPPLDPPRRMPPLGPAQANLKRLHDAGVVVAAGSDAGNIGTLHGAALHRELELMVEAGLTPAQALRAATEGAARVTGREKDLGTIEPGKLADLVVLDADPLADVRNVLQIHLVVKDGHPLRPDEILQRTPADVVQRQLNAYNAGDLQAFLDTYADDTVIVNEAKGGAVMQGKQALADVYGPLFEANPDNHAAIVDRKVRGNVVIDREHVTGRADGQDRQATAKYEIENGLIRRVTFLKI